MKKKKSFTRSATRPAMQTAMGTTPLKGNVFDHTFAIKQEQEDGPNEMPPFEKWHETEKLLYEAVRDILKTWSEARKYDSLDVQAQLVNPLLAYCRVLNPHTGVKGEVLMEGVEEMATEFLPLLGDALVDTTERWVEKGREAAAFGDERAKRIAATETRRFRSAVQFMADYVDRFN